MSPLSLLIVEDEAIVAEDLANKVRRMGYAVAGLSATGEEAVALARELRPALVLMDIRLAGAMDGIAAAEQIYRECQLPVLFLTAHSDMGTVGRAQQSNTYGYILKPFDERDLRIQIEMALYKHAAEQQLRQSAVDLQTANQTLHNSRVAALNMMEDSAAARRQADETNRALQREITERKKIEEALRRSRERLDLALDSSGMATFDWDIVNNKRTWSDGVHRLLGTDPETFTGTAEEFFQIIHPEDRSSVQASLDQAVATINGYEAEYRVVWPDGSRHHISARGKVHGDAAGRAVLLAGVCWDVTEAKRAEEQLWVQTRALKALNSGSHALLHATDEQSLLQAVCKTVVEDCGHAMVWIGYAEDDEERRVRPVASSGFEAGYLETLNITWADTERGRGPTGTAIRTGKPGGCADMRSDPAVEPWREAALARGYGSSLVLPLLEGDKAFGALSIYSTKAQAFAEAEVALLMQLVDELAYGIRMVRLRVAHDQAEAGLLTAYQRIELLAVTAGLLLASETPQQIADTVCRKVMAFLDCNVFFNFLIDEKAGRLHLNACAGIPETEKQKIEWLDYGVAVCGCVARDGGRIVAHDIATTLDPRTVLVKSFGIQAYACHPLIAQGRVLGTLSFGTRSRTSFSDDDLALMKAVADQVSLAMERKRVEEELRHAKEAAELATRAKSQFLANMSHELRTPMTGVIGMIDVVLSRQLEPEQQRKFLEIAQTSARSLVRILNDILDLTKIEMGKLNLEAIPFSLRNCVENTYSLLLTLAKNKGLEFNFSVADEVAETLIGDPTRLSQILTNLAGNAVKFTETGQVEIRVAAGDRTADGQQSLLFTVTDTGIGIPVNKQHLLFGAFSQVDESNSRIYGGTGLGLVISQELVERMGGTITFTSEAGKGSRFVCTIPFPLAEEERNAVVVSEKITPEGDAPATHERDLPRLLIAEDDATIRQVLGLLFQRANYVIEFADCGEKVIELWENGEFDLILMDVQMPRMNGFEATAAIRANERNRGGYIPIIAMTAHSLKEDEERCHAAGMDAYISKPIDFKKSLQIIEEVLRGKTSPAEGLP